MNKKQIKQCLIKGMQIQHQKLKGYETEKKEEEIIMNYNFKKIILPFSLVTVMSFGLAFGIFFGIKNKPETMISLDVNPAIEMKLNKDEKIVNIETKNEDAKKIVGDMKLKNVDASVGVNALIGSMFKNGYLKENSNDNDILLTVNNSDSAKSKEIKDKLTKTIKDTLDQNNSKAEILLQEDKITEEDEKIAEEYDITTGKAKFINKLLEKSPELSQEQLSKMTMRELVKYLEDKNVDYDDIIEKDDDTIDDKLDKEEDRQDLIKDEQERVEEQKEKEQEKQKEEQEKREERQEKIKEQQEEEKEKASEQQAEETE